MLRSTNSYFADCGGISVLGKAGDTLPHWIAEMGLAFKLYRIRHVSFGLQSMYSRSDLE